MAVAATASAEQRDMTRPAFYVPILGCLLQVGLGVLVVDLVFLAGPIT